MGLCSIATILKLFSLNYFWVFRPIFPLCCHIPGCGVYLDSWKSGKPQHALCAWAAYSLPGLLCVLLPPSWGCLRWVALIRHYLSLDTKLSHTNCSHVLQHLNGAIYPSIFCLLLPQATCITTLVDTWPLLPRDTCLGALSSVLSYLPLWRLLIFFNNHLQCRVVILDGRKSLSRPEGSLSRVREESEAGQALPWLLNWPDCDMRVFKLVQYPLLCHPKSVFGLKKINYAELSKFAAHTTA